MHKLDYQYVQQYFKKQGCQLLAKEYRGSKIKMRYRCNCGEIAETDWSSFRKGCRCWSCRNRKISNVHRQHNFDEVKKVFEDNGCKLNSEQYSSSNEHLKYTCECGSDAEIRFRDFLNGTRCLKCNAEKMSKKYRFAYEYVKQYFADNKCELLETEYQNNYTLLKYRCECGNESVINFHHFKDGNRCKICQKNNRSGDKHWFWNPDREEVKFNKIFCARARKLLSHSLMATGQRKDTKAQKMLGYDTLELKQHITMHPNWSVLQTKKWVIDHIFPIKAFLDYGIHDIKLMNGLDNLQPLEASENNRKSAKYCRKSFESYLRSKGVHA